MRPARQAVVVMGVVLAGLGLEASAAPGSRTAAAVPLPPPASASAARSLYQRLGEKPAIAAVVGEFLKRVAADVRISGRFANADIERLRGFLVEFICAATGGSCVYGGCDMHTAHAGFQLVDEEFDALVEDLTATLAALKVPQAEQNEVLAALAPLRPDIVSPPPPSAARADPALVESADAQVRSLRAAGQNQAAVSVVTVQPRQRVETVGGLLAVAQELNLTAVGARLDAANIAGRLETATGSTMLGTAQPPRGARAVEVLLQSPAAHGARLVLSVPTGLAWGQIAGALALLATAIVSAFVVGRGPHTRRQARGPRANR